MEDVYKQTANMFGMDEYLSAYRTKPTDDTPSLSRPNCAVFDSAFFLFATSFLVLSLSFQRFFNILYFAFCFVFACS